MEKHFEASTRDEAIRLADQWWNAQKGLTLVTRYIFSTPPAPKETSQWKVVIHYESTK
jgi:hypothetical protein